MDGSVLESKVNCSRNRDAAHKSMVKNASYRRRLLAVDEIERDASRFGRFGRKVSRSINQVGRVGSDIRNIYRFVFRFEF